MPIMVSPHLGHDRADGRVERHCYDVVVIGAGVAGMRAAIEAASYGARTALLGKSLLGKASSVMAGFGIAATAGRTMDQGNWQPHFCDTMRAGDFLGNWKMAQIHAVESPERVNELEQWGALFDRNADGTLQLRPATGHRTPRLAGLGDRTGLEILRTLQHQVDKVGVDVFLECSIHGLMTGDGRIIGALGFRRENGVLLQLGCPSVILATGGGSHAWDAASGSADQTGDGVVLALLAGAEVLDMEFVQFHPTGVMWPPRLRGMFISDAVLQAGGVLRNRLGASIATNLASTQHIAAGIAREIREGRGGRHGGVFLDIASQLSAESVRSLLPSLCRRLEMAGIDITCDLLEVAPVCHYTIGGVRVDAESTETTVSGLYAAGEVAAGMHGAGRLGGNALSEALVFGRRAGLQAARDADTRPPPASCSTAQLERHLRRTVLPSATQNNSSGPRVNVDRNADNPFILHRELQECMRTHAGVIRSGEGLRSALQTIQQLRARSERILVTGPRAYNPGWHLAMELPSLLLFSETVVRSALTRTESRGCHVRDDCLEADPDFACANVVAQLDNDRLELSSELKPPAPAEIVALFNAQERIHTWAKLQPNRPSYSRSGAATPSRASSRNIN